MTALPLRDFTAAEQAKLAAIEAAPAAEEAVRERVADELLTASILTPLSLDDCRVLADAAIAVLRGPSSDAERAFERVLQACDREENALGAEGGQYAWGVRYTLATIRAAVRGD